MTPTLDLLDCSTRARLTLCREEYPIADIDAAIVVTSVTDNRGEEFGEDELVVARIFISRKDLERLEIGRGDWLQDKNYIYVVTNSPVRINADYAVCKTQRKAVVRTTR